MSEEIYDPRERLEIFLNAVRTGDVEGLPDPQTREEMYLAAIAAKSGLPDTADASVGDALVLDVDKKPIWGKIGSDTLYQHFITLRSGTGANAITAIFSIIASKSSAFTVAELATYLADLGEGSFSCTGKYQSLGLSNSIHIRDNGTFQVFYTVFAVSNDTITVSSANGSQLPSSSWVITDTVHEIS